MFAYVRVRVARSAAQSMSLCPFCSSRHACAPGDIGGTAYADMGQAEMRLIDKLFRFRLVRAGSFVVRMCSAGGFGRAQPRDLQVFANVAGYTHGILLVHEGLRACFLFRAAQLPRLVSLSCGLRLLHSGCVAGFVLLSRERLRRLSVMRIKRHS